jgi:hypothetical protein
MSIKPILFNTEMVRAILDGRKTCTRRVIKPQPQSRLCYTYAGSHKGCVGKWTYPNRGAREFWGEEYRLPENIKDEELRKQWNPPYHTDDVLYIRETWTEECGKYYYRADYDSDYLDPCETLSGGYPASCRNHPGCDGCMATSTRIHWRPSIHMPKEAARIWLKITDVSVERLQDITEDGAKAEGIYTPNCRGCNATFRCDFWNEGYNEFDEFMEIWDSTIKKSNLDRYGWNANPWVWVIEFERCEKPEGV